MIEDRIKLLKFELSKEHESMIDEQKNFFNKNTTRVDDIQALLNELKDE